MPYDPAFPVPVETFRTAKPAFADANAYPDAQIAFYLDWAWRMVRVDRWRDSYELGQILWAAHFLALEAADEAAAAAGRPPGSVSGLTTSKSVGGVSIGYDMSTAAEENGGHWNQTTYGRMYLRFSRMAGAGGIQIGAGPTQIR